MSCPSPIVLSRALVEGVDDRLRAHLDICTDCSDAMAADAAITADVRDLATFEPSSDHAARVRDSLLAAATVPRPIARSRMVWGFALGGALAAAAVLIFLFAVPRSTPRAQVSHATILPHDGASMMRISDGPDEIVRLAEGTATVKIAALGPHERFRMITGDAELEAAADSAYDVAVDRDHLRSVRVISGQVIVRAQGMEPKVLREGERWEIELAQAPSGPAPEVAQQEAVAVTPDLPSVAPSDTSTKSPPKRHPSASLRAERPSATPSIPGRPKRPIETLFDEGWATLAAGDAVAAAATFQRAAQAAPTDPLAEDAWFWHGSALVRAKVPGASDALAAFLANYPSSPRLGEASAMLGWLVIDSDLDRAEKLFKTAAGDRVASVKASAQRGLAAIEQRRKSH